VNKKEAKKTFLNLVCACCASVRQGNARFLPLFYKKIDIPVLFGIWQLTPPAPRVSIRS
jgi:hypothetical protein